MAGRLHARGLAPRHDHDPAARARHPPSLAQRLRRIAYILEGIEAGDEVEAVVVEQQRLEIALPEIPAGRAFAHDLQQRLEGVQPGHRGAQRSRERSRHAGAAAGIEVARFGRDLRVGQIGVAGTPRNRDSGSRPSEGVKTSSLSAGTVARTSALLRR